MDADVKQAEKEFDCSDDTFRLSVYQAGHAITAYLMDQKIVSIQMLPRPPMTFTDKAFASNNWGAFVDILESRALELFGGQIAEQLVCNSLSCCSGDISRIDEITRILEALYGEEDLRSEDILFELEDRAEAMFAAQEVRDAIRPLANFLYQQEIDGHMEVDGTPISKLIEKYIAKPKKEKRSLLKMLKLA